MSKKKTIDPKTKLSLVLQMFDKKKSVGSIARENNVSEGSLHRWRDQCMAAMNASLSSGGMGHQGNKMELETLKKEIDERDRVIGELTVANNFLKKKFF